jgi:hypothetical protein
VKVTLLPSDAGDGVATIVAFDVRNVVLDGGWRAGLAALDRPPAGDLPTRVGRQLHARAVELSRRRSDKLRDILSL